MDITVFLASEGSLETGVHKFQATKFYTVPSKICGSSVKNFLISPLWRLEFGNWCKIF